MKNIPNIGFEGTENKKSFELLDLSKLFARIPTIVGHNPAQPHRVSFFALLMVTNDIGTHQVDLVDYQLKTGTVLKIAKGQVHAFQKDAQYEGFLLIFTEDFILNHFSQSSINIISHFYNYHITTLVFNE